ncbi:TIGR01777 family protein [Polaribacter reichenbachii]|uniref:Epimerase n=1 Tax=Polaribacter reichenbachii TaxID=996801 RepID=A0A1B8U502_9FLAO|nr:TIGR01777 family oxidoreductase [Polaribacter reichenbachii]APZ44777.1 TIGR01777 family protein [Polaribacter reichenbachii]AUC18641.1 TIGR01777 family protein [Polaribacter reichenbachii]OBY66936.1 epimerase [Polaribacter reichenbachii]
MAKIIITGGTGLVGTKLTELLIKNNHNVVILSRNPKHKNEYKWDVSKGFIDKNALVNIDYIIHLAGAGIADKRWTNERKKIIIDSRVKTANLLYEKVKEQNIQLKSFISASGIGYYGAITTDKIFEEIDNVGNDFLGEVCQKWEDAAHQFKTLNVPVTILRTGVVLSKKGGALEKMKTPIVTPLGSGKQYMPWIHIDDLCQLYLKSIEDNLSGIFNAVAPEHHTSHTFSKELAKNIKRPFIGIGVPSFMLKLIFGEMANILLEGSRISTKKIEKNGYSFRFETLKKALNNLF